MLIKSIDGNETLDSCQAIVVGDADIEIRLTLPRGAGEHQVAFKFRPQDGGSPLDGRPSVMFANPKPNRTVVRMEGFSSGTKEAASGVHIGEFSGGRDLLFSYVVESFPSEKGTESLRLVTLTLYSTGKEAT